jgi:uncharacterized protein (DUF1800 family)
MAFSQRRSLEHPAAHTLDALPAIPHAEATPAATTLPPLAVIALNRMGYGPRPGDIDAFNALGATDDTRLAAYVEQQLNPDAIDDSACQAHIDAARLRIKYDGDEGGRYPAVNEARALTSLTKSTPQLWQLANFNVPMHSAERDRPFQEVRVATWIRAVNSKRQLKEVLVDFWHNHFNVNGSGETQIAATFPVYDRDVIRKNCLGNFRTFLEDVAKSTAMMYYLDNYNNKVSGGEGGNENFARELFELHTFGSDNYYKFYDDRSLVGTITYNGQSYVKGYIDKDVYEAASCLTGWSIRNNDPREKNVGNDGTFVFKDFWHYDGVKLVLGKIIDSGGGEKDGRDVLDMLASHPLVAKHIVGKMCRRFISDDISTLGTLIDQAVGVWMENLTQPDQLKKVMQVILTSAEFKTTWGKKVKRPFEALVAFLRATNAQLPVDEVIPNKPNDGNYWSSLFWRVSSTGHRIFEWPTPTGHPDVASYWISTNSTLQRWNLPHIITQAWGGNLKIPAVTDWNPDADNRSVTQIVDAWIAQLFGYQIDATTRNEVLAFLAQGGDLNQKPTPTPKAPDWGRSDGLKERYRAAIQLLAASAEFHNR